MAVTTEIDLAAAESAAITSIEQLEALFGKPKQTSVGKESEAMSQAEQAFIRASPFHLLATANTDGMCDVSPRGDPPGSVHVLCDRTLILPERPATNGSIRYATSSSIRMWGCSSWRLALTRHCE